MIAKGKPNPDSNQERIVFGSYDLVYTSTSNYMNIRIISSIALNKLNNNVVHYFMRLYTGSILQGYWWTELYIDKDVVKK